MRSSAVKIPAKVRGIRGAVRFMLPGLRFWMGDMPAISCVMSIEDVVHFMPDKNDPDDPAVIVREDFQLDSGRPGNRQLSKPHLARIKRGLKENPDRLLLGTFTFALQDPGAIVIDPDTGTDDWPQPDSRELFDTVLFGLRTAAKLRTLDGQHRGDVLRDLWAEYVEEGANRELSLDEVRLAEFLRQTSVPVTIVLEADPGEIHRMFVTMAATKPIPSALIVAMDERSRVNRFGIEVAKRWNLLRNGGDAGRLEYHSNSTKGEKVFAASGVRSAAASTLIGFNDRSQDVRDKAMEKAFREVGGFDRAVEFVAERWNYAAEHMPGWRDIVAGADPGKIRDEYLVGSQAALYVVAGVLAACRAAGIDYKPAIDFMADRLPWRKQDVQYRDGKPEHQFFEGVLVYTERAENEDGTPGPAVPRTAGGNRTQYMAATRRVLDELAREARFEDLTSHETLQEIGLAAGRRGRPRKAA